MIFNNIFLIFKISSIFIYIIIFLTCDICWSFNCLNCVAFSPNLEKKSKALARGIASLNFLIINTSAKSSTVLIRILLSKVSKALIAGEDEDDILHEFTKYKSFKEMPSLKQINQIVFVD